MVSPVPLVTDQSVSAQLWVTVNVDCQLLRNESIIEFFIYIRRQSVMEGKSTYPEERKIEKNLTSCATRKRRFFWRS